MAFNAANPLDSVCSGLGSFGFNALLTMGALFKTHEDIGLIPRLIEEYFFSNRKEELRLP